MSISIEEARAFIKEADRARNDCWLPMAKRSWDEIKKRQKNNRLWAATPNSIKRRQKYPAWYSIFKIRQPLLLSRVGVPIGKDTTQDGNDNVGATAAILKERLAVNLAKTFDFFGYLCSCRDDFLATNFGFGRAYYEKKDVKQKVKEYIFPEIPEDGSEPQFVDAAGEVVEEDDVYEDDEGYFIEHDEVVDVENEAVCLEHILYSRVYIDPGVVRFGRCRRIAFEKYYSRREFKEIFGAEALLDLASQDIDKGGDSEATPKDQDIKVFEYWDDYDKETLYWADNGSKFIRPKSYLVPDGDDDSAYRDEPTNGIYDLEKFFPVPDPLLTNNATDEFWPTPEYYQMQEVIEDIHTIFSRIVTTTRAYRSRLLFDNNVDGLQEALSEATEADAFGVPNLAQSLASAGGSLDAVVQYIPTQVIIESLNNLYTSLEQRLSTLFKLTGTSDLLQGLTTTNTDKTLGERQMEEKYAINQIAEPQRKMQEFTRASYELLCEMALKNFKDSSLDMYIMPQTLQPEDRQRYRAALGMLKEDNKRFRIDLETDSTIALNEAYEKQIAGEMVNIMTTGLEKVASIAASNRALVVPTLHAMKYFVQSQRQGKMFQSEVTQSIENVIKEIEATPPTPDREEQEMQLKIQEMGAKQAETQASFDLRREEIYSRERIEGFKMQQMNALKDLETQVKTYQIQTDAATEAQKISAGFQETFSKINTDIAIARESFALDREKLLLEVEKARGSREIEAFRLALEERLAIAEQQLAQTSQMLKAQEAHQSLEERWATEQRLQQEEQFNAVLSQLEVVKRVQELQQAQVPAPPPNVVVQMPQPPSKKKKVKIKRDKDGNMTDLDYEDVEEVGEI